MLWSLSKILSPVARVVPSTDWPFAKAEPSVPFAVVARRTESLKSSPVFTASTYSFVASEVAPKPALFL